MPAVSLDTADAAGLAELLQLLAGWLAAGPARPGPSLQAYIGHPAYSLDTLRADLERFVFLLGGNDSEHVPSPVSRPCSLSPAHWWPGLGARGP